MKTRVSAGNTGTDEKMDTPSLSLADRIKRIRSKKTCDEEIPAEPELVPQPQKSLVSRLKSARQAIKGQKTEREPRRSSRKKSPVQPAGESLASRIAKASKKSKQDKSTEDTETDRRMTLLADRARDMAGRLDKLKAAREKVLEETRAAMASAAEEIVKLTPPHPVTIPEDSFVFDEEEVQSTKRRRSSRKITIASPPTVAASTPLREMPPLDALVASPIMPADQENTPHRAAVDDMLAEPLIDTNDASMSILSEKQVVTVKPAKRKATQKEFADGAADEAERMRMHFEQLDELSLSALGAL